MSAMNVSYVQTPVKNLDMPRNQSNGWTDIYGKLNKSMLNIKYVVKEKAFIQTHQKIWTMRWVDFFWRMKKNFSLNLYIKEFFWGLVTRQILCCKKHLLFPFRCIVHIS